MAPRTFQSFVEAEPETQRRIAEAIEWAKGQELDLSKARARMLACRPGPQEFISDPWTIIAARHVWDDQPAHHCYWNDRFAVAVLGGLSLAELRIGAWCVVSNGLNDYFEWKTHSGFDMDRVLNFLGIDTSHDRLRPEGFPAYCELSDDICSKLVAMFNLPTTAFHHKTNLTDVERKESDEFNRQYGYRPIL